MNLGGTPAKYRFEHEWDEVFDRIVEDWADSPVQVGVEHYDEETRERLKEDEGSRGHPYDDADGKRIVAPKGYVTIGIGRNLDANPLTDTEQAQLLYNDVQRSHKDLCFIFGKDRVEDWARYRYTGLLSMMFNLGRTRFSGFRKMIAAIKSESWPEAAREALDSKWANQVGVRAERIAFLIEKGRHWYENPGSPTG